MIMMKTLIKIIHTNRKRWNKKRRKKEAHPNRLDFNKSRPSPLLAYITITDSDESSHVFFTLHCLFITFYF